MGCSREFNQIVAIPGRSTSGKPATPHRKGFARQCSRFQSPSTSIAANLVRLAVNWGTAGCLERTLIFFCANLASTALIWRTARPNRGAEVMARPQTGLLLQHIQRLAGRDAAAGRSDTDLLRHFLGEEDEAAFTALVQRHGAMVWQVCI